MTAWALLIGFSGGVLLGVRVGWAARTWPHPDDEPARRRHAAALDALDRIDARRTVARGSR